MKIFAYFFTFAVLVMAQAAESPPKEMGLAGFEKLATEGDPQAMTELGLRYHQGRGVKQDYALAYDWYMKAIEKGDGDAFNNLGVMHRDGLGVPKNQKVAYLIFLAIHMEGMGTDSTQIRAGRNLQKLVDQLPKTDLYEALSYTWPYVIQILESRGKDLSVGPDVLPAKDRPPIRNNGWWTDSERAGMTFDSPPPWNGKK
jgi:hypothetical protein